MNSVGMLVALALVVVLTLVSGLEWVVTAAVAIFGGTKFPEMTDIVQLAWIFLGFTAICVIMLGILVIMTQRHERRGGS